VHYTIFNTSIKYGVYAPFCPLYFLFNPQTVHPFAPMARVNARLGTIYEQIGLPEEAHKRFSQLESENQVRMWRRNPDSRCKDCSSQADHFSAKRIPTARAERVVMHEYDATEANVGVKLKLATVSPSRDLFAASPGCEISSPGIEDVQAKGKRA
jgi:hypothetical protein